MIHRTNPSVSHHFMIYRKKCCFIKISTAMQWQCFFSNVNFPWKKWKTGGQRMRIQNCKDTRAYITDIAEARWQRGAHKTYISWNQRKSCEVLVVLLDQFKTKPQIGGKYTICLILHNRLFYKAVLLARFISQQQEKNTSSVLELMDSLCKWTTR